MLSSWEGLFALVLSAIPIIESRKDNDHERATKAFAALSDAYYSTLTYYECPITDLKEIRKAQIEIANKWDKAANLMLPFNTDLWNRFNLKTKFWEEGGAWTNEQINSANIGLETVRKDGRLLLATKQITDKNRYS